ncbi:MAG TPA: GxxExxY protein [Acetobacteraceae bacterium]|nr:GxxExxY protein [Acetobacteraceae bacterium]
MHQNALAQEMRNPSLGVARQRRIARRYATETVDKYAVDSIVDEQVIIELKATGKPL